MINANSDVVLKIKERYKDLHPLIVHRSGERAKSDSDLFDILDVLRTNLKDGMLYPIVWNEENHCWSHTKDLFQSVVFFEKSQDEVV
jgi:hypothetical protein